MLYIKATSYRKLPKPAYKWASGMLMRIYNDNRMMLHYYSHRMRIGVGFRELIKLLVKTAENHVLHILGTSTSGIAPAATVAQLMKKKLLINHKGKFYIYENDLCSRNLIGLIKSWKPDAIVSTTPFAIPYGVQYANALKTGFAYIRPGAKDHGKEKQIEGNLKKGMRIVLITCPSKEETWETIEKTESALKENGYEVVLVCKMEDSFVHHRIVTSDELGGCNVVVIEDLFSTGGSAAYEVYQVREAGAVCNYCFSIFSYGFDVLKKQFSGESMIGTKGVKLYTPCEIESLLPFDVLKSEMERMNFYTPSVRQSLAEEIDGFDKNYQEFLATS